MKYAYHKDIKKSLFELNKRGGQYQIAAKKVSQLIGDINMGHNDPFESLKCTIHGETRIKKCSKYDLSGFCRLIVIKDKNLTSLLFVGTHDECDKWLNANKGLTLVIDKDTTEIKNVFQTQDINKPELRVADDTDYSSGRLIDKLKGWQVEYISDLISGSKILPFLQMNSLVEEDEILNASLKIDDETVQVLYFDVFMNLKSGKNEEAKNLIHQYRDELIALEKADEELIEKTISNDQYLMMDDFREQDIELILKNANWHEWMLFMHPQQRIVVEKDFKGPSRLLGVSGSGKTSVIVNRAIRMSKKYPEEKILILTINRALSKLIQDLIKHALVNEKDNEIDNIEVKSFWKLCQEMLIEFDPQNKVLYNDITHKNLEDVEEIWDEYYQCEANNNDAYVMEPIHRSLLSRGLFPTSYIKQEFDWIRSAMSNGDQDKYLKIEREGRKVSFPPEFRSNILKGLRFWEDKMKFVGVVDYMGLIRPMHDHLDKIRPKYRCILVDELQDFGTSELYIVRKLVEEGENDIFLSGDIAQQVYTKHHKLTQAGIKIIPENYMKIYKNYRNSREILEAAYSVFSTNINIDHYENDDFELLSPEYANFSSPKPFIRKSKNLSMEFSNSLSYMNSILDEDHKGCIAISGYSYYDINKIGSKLQLPVLNGKSDLSEGNIFISDLEQTKGFEFDRMIIVNANKGIIPNPDFPKDEWYREISRIYVAMTRAKKELIISFSTELSSIFEGSIGKFELTNWSDYFDESVNIEKIKLPKPRQDLLLDKYSKMTAKEFLYTRRAIGFSSDAQMKLRETIMGKKSSSNGLQTQWENIGNFVEEINRMRLTPHLNRILGPSVFKEIVSKFNIKGFD